MNISNYKIVVTESILKISDGNRTRSCCSQMIVLYDAKKAVPKGYTENFSCNVKLPPEFAGYTAIGNIISRTYHLALVA